MINAFNQDKPYNRFIQEQLAGDELFPAQKAAKGALQDAHEMEEMLKEVKPHFVQKGNALDSDSRQ